MKALLLNRVILVLAFIGLYVSGVLSMQHALKDFDIPCGTSNACAAVAAHPASKLFGIPVAYLGFLSYLIVAIMAGVRGLNGMRNAQKSVMAAYAIAAVGTVFSLYLQYQAYVVIKQVCPWCLSSAIVMVVLLVAHAALASASEAAPVEVEERSSMDSVLLMGLPLVLILGLGFQVANSKAALQVADRAGAVVEATLPSNAAQLLIPAQPNAFGAADAPITIVEFADLACGACQVKSPAVKEFVSQHPGKVRLIFRHFPLDMHKFSKIGAVVSEQAADKGKFWEFTLAVMALRREVESPAELITIAQSHGMDRAEIEKRLANPDDPAYARVAEDLRIVGELGLMQTPTFFIMDPEGNIDMATSKDILEKLQTDKYKKYLNG